MATTYKRRQRTGILDEKLRSQAVKRIKDEFNVRAKTTPEAQRKAAERTREARNKERIVNSHGGAVKAPKAGGDHLRNLPRRHQTTRGLRRLSFRQAYSRRTTDSSRARVLKLYGRDKPPVGHRGTLTRPGGPAGSFGRGTKPSIPKVGQRGSRRIHKPVATGSPEQQAARMRARAQSKRRAPRMRRTGGAVFR